MNVEGVGKGIEGVGRLGGVGWRALRRGGLCADKANGLRELTRATRLERF